MDRNAFSTAFILSCIAVVMFVPSKYIMALCVVVPVLALVGAMAWETYKEKMS